MFKFFKKQLYRKIFKRGLRTGFKEGYRRGIILGSKGFVKLNPKEFGSYLDIYNDIHHFAVKVNLVSFKKYNPPSKLADHSILSRGCLYKIGERAVILHNSVLSLCEDGWASVAPVIIRSLMDCFINSIVIASKDSEYMAFRFYVHEDLNMMIDKNIAQEAKNSSRDQVAQQLRRLSQVDQQRAKVYVDDFLKRTKPKNYWYKPEYAHTGDILSLCKKGSGIPEAFKVLSMSTHSTFLGSQLFKDQPDKTDINPRLDPESIKLALVGSASMLLEVMSVREQFETLDLSSEAQLLRLKKLKLKQFI